MERPWTSLAVVSRAQRHDRCEPLAGLTQRDPQPRIDPTDPGRTPGADHDSCGPTGPSRRGTPDRLGLLARSLGSGVDPEGGAPSVDLVDDDLRAYRDAHPLAAVMPVIRKLLVEDAESDKMIVAVTDAGGCLLWVEGDSRLRSQGRGHPLRRGRQLGRITRGYERPGDRLGPRPLRAGLSQRALPPARPAVELQCSAGARSDDRPVARRAGRHRW